MTGQWGELRKKNATLWFTYTFLEFLFVAVVFHQNFSVSTIFISFFDKASNLHNRILTNQKSELVIRNCQWNCMNSSENKFSKDAMSSKSLQSHMNLKIEAV